MDVPNEPGAVLISILVIIMFLVLLVLQKRTLTERQQTAVWVVFTILFFSICNMFFHGGAGTGLATGARMDSAGVADIPQPGIGK